MNQAENILKEFWGYTQFREPQGAIINNVLEKKDVLALLPTGLGKSVCFQVPTLMQETGICLVISPLIALMQDQVENLQKRGIKAVALTGLLSKDEIIRLFDNLQFGGIRFLYISPERLQSNFIQEKVKQLPLSLIAIDEAHCISEWGHDFRPSYLRLNVLRELHPNVNIIALTATATEQVLKDIITYLELENPITYKQSIVRKKLHLRVLEAVDGLDRLYHLIKPIQEPVIIYAGSRNKCEQTSVYLNSKGLQSVYYHAGLSKEVKERASEKWFKEECPIMVATNAFGMGIDKSNVRMVVHTGIPYSIENYVQEAGRAGRDGKKSYAVIISDLSYLKDAKVFFSKSIPTIQFIKKLYESLNQFFQITYGDLPTKAFPFQFSNFCRQYHLPILKTHNALELLEREGIIEIITTGKWGTYLVFTANNEQLFAYYQRNPKKEKILKLLLRTYDGIYKSHQLVDRFRLAKKLQISSRELENHLEEMAKDKIISYQKNTHDTKLLFLKPREDQYTINSIASTIKQQEKNKKDKYQNVLKYIENKKICRNRILATYFGETASADCGICDLCQQKKNPNSMSQKELKNQILALLQKQNLSSKEIIGQLNADTEAVLARLRFLLESEVIVLDLQNKYVYVG